MCGDDQVRDAAIRCNQVGLWARQRREASRQTAALRHYRCYPFEPLRKQGEGRPIQFRTFQTSHLVERPALDRVDRNRRGARRRGVKCLDSSSEPARQQKPYVECSCVLMGPSDWSKHLFEHRIRPNSYPQVPPWRVGYAYLFPSSVPGSFRIVLRASLCFARTALA